MITGIFAYYLLNNTDVGTGMLIPFTGGFEKWACILSCPGFLFVPLLFFRYPWYGKTAPTSQMGLDGLLSSVTVMVAIFFTVVAAGKGQRHHAGDCSGGGKSFGISYV